MDLVRIRGDPCVLAYMSLITASTHRIQKEKKQG
jgi:hypothetical protein